MGISNTDVPSRAGVHVDVPSYETGFVEATWAYDQNGELYAQLVDASADYAEETLGEFAVPDHVVELTPYFFFSGSSCCGQVAAQGINFGTATIWPVTAE